MRPRSRLPRRAGGKIQSRSMLSTPSRSRSRIEGPGQRLGHARVRVLARFDRDSCADLFGPRARHGFDASRPARPPPPAPWGPARPRRTPSRVRPPSKPRASVFTSTAPLERNEILTSPDCVARKRSPTSVPSIERGMSTIPSRSSAVAPSSSYGLLGDLHPGNAASVVVHERVERMAQQSVLPQRRGAVYALVHDVGPDARSMVSETTRWQPAVALSKRKPPVSVRIAT
jgi:hypothetical protein